MSVAKQRDLRQYCVDVAVRAHRASAKLATVSGQQKIDWLHCSAEALRREIDSLVAANQQDLDAAPGFGLTEAAIDRLRLTPAQIENLAAALEEIAALDDPIGEIIESTVRPNGLEIQKVRVPLGVVFFIYESRPNVTADAAALCVKSGNAVILRGGKEAAHSNRAVADILIATLSDFGLPTDAIQLVNTPDREAVGHFLKLDEYIDVTIPRGGESLIRRVVAEARMPVIKHYDGNCHVYIDCNADLNMAAEVTLNSKCQRYGVCNAAESLLVHADVASEFLPGLGNALKQQDVEVRGDARTCELIAGATDATEADYRAEFLAPIISVKIVASLQEAIDHINHFGSHHTDAIITGNLNTARQFAVSVDSAAVMINTSTRFNDGGQFGLGAEIGISTDKLHARGPCGLKELTSYKYVCYGNGQIRS